MIALDVMPFQITPWPPTAAIVAPTMPPISACEELEGIPSSQVSRFQTMPPTRPAKTSSSVTMCPSMSPLAIVAATAVDMKAPTRLSTADSVTATLGFNAPLAMDVAMALAVSWKPLVKSNASAVITTMIKRNRSMFTGPDSDGRGIKLSNGRLGQMQEYRQPSPDVTHQLTEVRLLFTSGIATKWVVRGDVDEDEGDSVRIRDVHLVQPPRLLASLAGNRHATALQFGLSRPDVAHLKPKRSGKRATRMVLRPESRQLQQGLPGVKHCARTVIAEDGKPDLVAVEPQ